MKIELVDEKIEFEKDTLTIKPYKSDNKYLNMYVKFIIPEDLDNTIYSNMFKQSFKDLNNKKGIIVKIRNCHLVSVYFEDAKTRKCHTKAYDSFIHLNNLEIIDENGNEKLLKHYKKYFKNGDIKEEK